MGRKKKESAKRFSPQDLKNLWKKVPIETWLGVFQKLNREGQWRINGHSIIGRCPYHEDNNPSCHLNFDKGFGKCFGCGKAITDLVAFAAKLQNTSYTAALITLDADLGILKIIGVQSADLEEYHKCQEMKKQAAMAMNKVITEYIREKPEHLSYLRPGLAYLFKARNIPYETISALPIGLYAKPEHLKKYIEVKLHPVFDSYFDKTKGALHYGAICFHYNNEPGCISRFKIRTLSTTAQDAVKKYKTVSEIQSDIAHNFIDKNFTMIDDPFIQETGIYGLHHYIRLIGSNETSAYITEGEFDALSVMAAQVQNGIAPFMMLAMGGSGNSGLSFLREFGIRTVWVVADAPSKRGDVVVTQLLQNDKNFIGDSVNKALEYRIFAWPANIQGDDLDQVVQRMGYEQVLNYISTERNKYFQNTYTWVTTKCDAELKNMKLDAEEQEPQLLKKNTYDILSKWLRCLHDKMDKSSFIQKYSKSENIELESLESVNRALYNLDTMQGAVDRVVEALNEHIELVYYEQIKGVNQFTLWSKTRHEKAVVMMSDSKIEEILSQYLNDSMMSWMPKVLAGSALIEKLQDEGEVAYTKRLLGVLLLILRQALMKMLASALPVDQMHVIGQGIHYDNLIGSSGSYMYFVNGNKVYKGTFNAPSGAPVEWEFVNSIVDNNFLFKLRPGDRWSEVEDISDLYAGSRVDLHKLYNDLLELLDGWKFENHELTKQYIAAWIMSIPIQKAIGQTTLVCITGDSTSGKTSFSRGLLGGYGSGGYDVPYILEGAKFTSDPTAAWIYQEMDQSALLLSIDEAETQGEGQHKNRIVETHNMLYCVPTGGAKLTRGGSTADQRVEYNVRTPIIEAAIHMSSDPTYLTRVIVFYTQKDVNRQNIGDYIAARFSEQRIKDMRRALTIGLLPHIPEIKRRMDRLRLLAAQEEHSIKVSARTLQLLVPAMAVYDFLGFDAIDIYKKWIAANKNLLESLNSQEFQSELINAVLYTKGIKTNIDDTITDYTSASYLIKRGDIETLNKANSGVAFIPEKSWIIIVWKEVKYTLLKFTEFGKQKDISLRESISRNKYLVSKIDDEEHKYIIKYLDRTDIKNSSQYSVVQAAYLLNSEQCERIREAPPEVYGFDGPFEYDPDVNFSF